jgi:hypothetical protein
VRRVAFKGAFIRRGRIVLYKLIVKYDIVLKRQVRFNVTFKGALFVENALLYTNGEEWPIN